MLVSKYFVLFTVFSCLGWIYETIYVTVKTGNWANRGFLFGPVCPIYGAGGVGISIVFDLLQASGMATNITWWQIFLLSYLGSIVLEYPTHFILEKKFHAYWWDYSDAPFNIHGRVCLPASIGFGCAGVLIYYVLYPAVASVVNPIPLYLMEVLSLLMMALIAGDTALTVAALTNLVKTLENMEETIDHQMEGLVNGLEEKKNEMENVLNSSRELLTVEHLERTLKDMSAVRRSALLRIKGFAPHKGVHHIRTYDRMKRLWKMAKEKVRI